MKLILSLALFVTAFTVDAGFSDKTNGEFVTISGKVSDVKADLLITSRSS